MAVTLLLLVIAMTASLYSLNFKEDIADFLPNNENNKKINSVYQHIANSNKIILNFWLDSYETDAEAAAEKTMAAIDRFVELAKENDSLKNIEIFYLIDEYEILELTNFIRQNAPYFMTEADYAHIDSLTQKERVFSQMKENKRLLMLPDGGFIRQSIMSDPLHLFTPLLSRMKDFQAGNKEQINQGYIFSADGKKGKIILTTPYGVSETAKNTELIELINKVTDEVISEHKGMKISCFGAPAIAVTNASQIKKDSILAFSLAIVLILSLLIWFFRNIRNILLIFVSVLIGVLFSLSLLLLWKSSISLIAIGIGSIFIGIAINYPLHFIDHLKHQPNVKLALKEIAPPLLIGNITTVSAFLSLVFLSSNAMSDLGLFGSLLLVGCMLFTLTYLPHLVKVSPKSLKIVTSFGKLASFSPERNKWVIWSIIVLTAVFLYFSRFTTFEADMNKINYMTTQQREDMNEAFQSLTDENLDVVYLISEGKQLDNALETSEKNRKITDLLIHNGEIERVAGIGNFLPSKEEQAKRIALWNRFRNAKRDSILIYLEEAAVSESFKINAFNNFIEMFDEELQVHDDRFFAPITDNLTGNYLINNESGNMVVNMLYCPKGETEKLMASLETHSLTNTFFFDSRSIAYRMVDALSNDFNFVLLICGFIVFGFLTLSFGRFELSLLAFIPLAVSWIWILGLMQIGDIRFNIVNIILATFIFGQGDDYTIFITEGLMYEYTYRRKMLAAYKNSIILSAIIMFIGIGVLIFSKHPAMKSLAEVTIVGMFSVVVMAYIIPPLIFNWLTKTKEGVREVPMTIKRIAFSLYSFTAFLIGSMALTIYGSILLGLGGRTEKNKLRYHKFLRASSEFVVKRIPGVSFKLENLTGETFEKPGVIISNHQSHLDLMCLIMLNPKLIVLTNDWVWNNIFYGILIRFADYYPVSNGIENSIDKLTDRVKNGYSIVVFPEGTRSEDCSIGRFRKGAFYLAGTLNIDIIPVVLHGLGHVLPKKDFMLREGAITVQINPRITPKKTDLDDNFLSITKQTRNHYSNMYSVLSNREEKSDYFKSYIIHSYLYKGSGIERTIRRNLKADFQSINSYAGNGPVLVKNNGLGEFSFLFALVHKHVHVYAVDNDKDNIDIASACCGLPPNITICAEEELTDIQFEMVFNG